MTHNRSFLNFYKTTSSHLFTAIFNLFIFLPYYFSVIRLLTTLLHPWKHLVAHKTRPGFSLEEWAGRISFNAISSGVGFVMRCLVLVTYVLIQMLFVLSLPFVILAYTLLTPFLYLGSFFEKPADERKRVLRQDFFKKRLLDEDNQAVVSQWFEVFYATYINKTPWWHLNSLFATPPLGRDWSAGYTPNLNRFSEELTKGKTHFKTLVDREKEIQQLSLVLSKSEEANVVVVGDEGVGKHTIVEALAKSIFEGKINPMLAYKRILKLDMERVIAQASDVSQKEALLKSLFEEARDAGNIIIFIDNFDKYISSGTSERIDLTTSIASYARSGQIQFIAITTPFFYQKYVITNAAINRLFEKIDVFEISQKEAMEILLKAAFEIESRFHLIIPYETIKETIEKSNFYITTIPFPEKAISLLDEACVYLTEQTINKNRSSIVTPEMIDAILTQKTHIPVRLNQSLKNKLINLESLLSQRIISQKEAIDKLSAAMRKSFTLASSRKKPLASFLFLGPTGVGKTETAKALSAVFFGSDDYLIRFDMSFYQNQNDIATLIGSIASGNPGLLTVAIREKPYGVLLLDEIEKGHKDLLNIFLTVLDEGYFTDGVGKKVDCKHLIVIATSNAGSGFIFQQSAVAVGLPSQNEIVNYIISKRLFTPEFLNRFDGVILYQPLGPEALLIITKHMLDVVAGEAQKTYGIRLSISEAFLQQLITKGWDRQFGARNMARVIRDQVEDKIARLVLTDKIKKGETMTF